MTLKEKSDELLARVLAFEAFMTYVADRLEEINSR
jgi:hypothetical protein